MIVSETFYQAKCDANGCDRIAPTDDDEGASHYPMDSLREWLADERGEFDETWTVVNSPAGELTYCPQHKPGNIDCTDCGSEGWIKSADAAPREFAWERCATCEGRGYLSPVVSR